MNDDKIGLEKMRTALADIPRYSPAHVEIAGWKLDFVDAPALLSCFEVIVVKRWNDFVCAKPDPVILDCGSNIGVSIIHYKRQFPNARITGFEPDKAICHVLRRNLAQNGINDVEIVEAAVWKSNGRQPFFAEGADGSKLVSSDRDSIKSTYFVDTVRFADYLSRGPVDFVKMDIEGAESQVIPDCAPFLQKVQNMIIEYHYFTNAADSFAQTLKVLASSGFNLSLNSYGQWIDLGNRVNVLPTDASCEQYFLICAWR